MTRQTKSVRSVACWFADQNRIYELQARLGEDRLRYVGDDERLGLAYRDGDALVVWYGGPMVVVSVPGAAIKQRYMLRNLYGKGMTMPQLRSRMCREGDVLCQEIIDDYRAEIEREISEYLANPNPHLRLVVSKRDD